MMRRLRDPLDRAQQVANAPILPRVPPDWPFSEQQRDRLEQIAGAYPGAHFQAVMRWPLSCAITIEWYQSGEGGEFLLAPNGHVLAANGDLYAGQPDVPVETP